jgi:hypothetical protein
VNRYKNKHWIREKEYISLTDELDRLLDISSNHKKFEINSSSEVEYIRRKLKHKFYDIYYGWYNTAPKHHRKYLNRKRRRSNRNILKRESIGYDYVAYNDNYKDASWYW